MGIDFYILYSDFLIFVWCLLVSWFFAFFEDSAEEVIKQELQAVAEDVAASVLQSSVPSNPEFPVFGGSKYGSISEHNSEVQSSDGETLDRNKFEVLFCL